MAGKTGVSQNGAKEINFGKLCELQFWFNQKETQKLFETKNCDGSTVDTFSVDFECTITI